MPRFDVHVPADLNEASRFLEEKAGEATIICNGSDLLPRIRRGHLKPKLMLDVSGFKELKYVRRDNGVVRIGSLTTITELIESSALKGPYEAFQNVASLFGASHIRNVATVGGNLGAAASSEDLIPLLLTLDAKVKLASYKGTREVPLEKFVVGKRQVDIRLGEIITEVFFDSLKQGSWTSFQKIGRRGSLIIAFVSLASMLQLDKQTKKILDVKLALNRVKGKIPERARETEKILIGKPFDNSLLQKAADVLGSELKLTADYRASAEYRYEIAKVYLERGLNYCAGRILGN